MDHHRRQIPQGKAVERRPALQPLRADGEPPFYKYVSVEGPIVDVAPAELEADRRPLAHRYFGPELGDAYVASTDGEGNLKFSMRPTRWWSVDYTKS